MSITFHTPPATEPLSVAEVMTHCVLEPAGFAETAHLHVLIQSARQAAEGMTGRYLITQTLEKSLDRFPAEILLPPLQSVDLITYIDSDGVEQTLSADDYTVDYRSRPARIRPAHSKAWPGTREQMGAVIVRFVAGYGDASSVPGTIKLWMLQRIATAIANRESVIVGASVTELSRDYVDTLIDAERVYMSAM